MTNETNAADLLRGLVILTHSLPPILLRRQKDPQRWHTAGRKTCKVILLNIIILPFWGIIIKNGVEK
jgi:hypothetical protein